MKTVVRDNVYPAKRDAGNVSEKTVLSETLETSRKNPGQTLRRYQALRYCSEALRNENPASHSLLPVVSAGVPVEAGRMSARSASKGLMFGLVSLACIALAAVTFVLGLVAAPFLIVSIIAIALSLGCMIIGLVFSIVELLTPDLPRGPAIGGLLVFLLVAGFFTAIGYVISLL
jgi:hypothetical protein